MPLDTLIRRGSVVLPHGVEFADIAIEGGTIVLVESEIAGAGS